MAFAPPHGALATARWRERVRIERERAIEEDDEGVEPLRRSNPLASSVSHQALRPQFVQILGGRPFAAPVLPMDMRPTSVRVVGKTRACGESDNRGRGLINEEKQVVAVQAQ